MRILYIQSSYVPPPQDQQTDRFFLLSEKLEGDILAPVWGSSPDQMESLFGPGSYPAYTVGKFRYHWMLAWRYQGIRRKLAVFWFYLRKGLELHRQRKFDCIVVYSHQTTALLAVLLKLLTGTRLIAEIATTPHLVRLVERPHPTLADRLSNRFFNLCLYVVGHMSACLHLLSPDQLSHYPSLRKVPGAVFHEFVPISMIDRPPEPVKGGGTYILLVGAPWYLKGADLLIQAFHRLAPDFPDVNLRLLGHYPDRQELDALINGSPRIEIISGKPYKETLQLIAGAAVLVLPSRCEGMGRVLLEAMGAGVPVVGSDIGGIPFVVHDGENGLIFPSGDSLALEARLRLLLGNSELRQRLGNRGYEMAHSHFNEKVYVEEFARMVEMAIGNLSHKLSAVSDQPTA